MKIITTSIVIGQLMLIGAIPVAARQPPLSPGAAQLVQLAANDDKTADRTSFTHDARKKTAEWSRKLKAIGEKADANGKAAASAADDNLNKAWTKVKVASRQLETAGDEGWENAKTTYEKASRDLATAWRKIHPKDK